MKTSLAIALFVVSFVFGCAATMQSSHDLEVQKVATAKLTDAEACQKMKAFHQGSIDATIAYSKQNGANDSLQMTVLSSDCRGYAMIAEVLITAVIDGEMVAIISVSGLRVHPDGTIDGEVLGTREPVEEEKSRLNSI